MVSPDPGRLYHNISFILILSCLSNFISVLAMFCLPLFHYIRKGRLEYPFLWCSSRYWSLKVESAKSWSLEYPSIWKIYSGSARGKNAGIRSEPSWHFTCRILHYSDAIMRAMASQIIGVSLVCSSVFSGADKKNQNAASLAFVRGIHR